MSQAVKHFSLHRIDGTELRVIADVETGVLSVIGIEEEVIRKYIAAGIWTHERVTLFILEDLQPLVRQLRSLAELPPGGEQVLQQRPIVNLYDLADSAGCQIFVNRRAMVEEGYWARGPIVRALLAHEHAHPLAECETTAASRGLRLELSAEGLRDALGDEKRYAEVCRVLSDLGRKLGPDAPREVLANELTIRSGFADAMLSLDRRNVANAKSSLAGREQVAGEIERGIGAGKLTRQAADALLLVGDMQGGYLDLAMETAPFYRAGSERQARDLERVLEKDVFPNLRPGVGRAYAALRDCYIALRPDMGASSLAGWCEDVVGILAGVLADEGLNVEYRMSEG